MALYDPPASFTQRLARFDPLLRIRWSDSEQRWLIERKITRSRPVPAKWFRRHEDFVAARDGYVHVLACQKNQLDERVFLTLWHGDIWRQGGARQVADRMDAQMDGDAERQRQGWLDDVEYAAREAYDSMNRVRTLAPGVTHTRRDLSLNND